MRCAGNGVGSTIQGRGQAAQHVYMRLYVVPTDVHALYWLLYASALQSPIVLDTTRVDLRLRLPILATSRSFRERRCHTWSPRRKSLTLGNLRAVSQIHGPVCQLWLLFVLHMESDLQRS